MCSFSTGPFVQGYVFNFDSQTFSCVFFFNYKFCNFDSQAITFPNARPSCGTDGRDTAAAGLLQAPVRKPPEFRRISFFVLLTFTGFFCCCSAPRILTEWVLRYDTCVERGGVALKNSRLTSMPATVVSLCLLLRLASRPPVVVNTDDRPPPTVRPHPSSATRCHAPDPTTMNPHQQMSIVLLGSHGDGVRGADG